MNETEDGDDIFNVFGVKEKSPKKQHRDDKIQKTPAEIVRFLMFQGVMATVNQLIDVETIKKVCAEYDFRHYHIYYHRYLFHGKGQGIHCVCAGFLYPWLCIQPDVQPDELPCPSGRKSLHQKKRLRKANFLFKRLCQGNTVESGCIQYFI